MAIPIRNKTIKPNKTNNKKATFATRLFDCINPLSIPELPLVPVLPDINLLKGFELDPESVFILYIYYKIKTLFLSFKY